MLTVRAGTRVAQRPAVRYFSFSAPRSKSRLLILGSGWGGYEVLRGIDKDRWSTFLCFSLLLLITNIFVQMSQSCPRPIISTSRLYSRAVLSERWNFEQRLNRYVLRDSISYSILNLLRRCDGTLPKWYVVSNHRTCLSESAYPEIVPSVV